MLKSHLSAHDKRVLLRKQLHEGTKPLRFPGVFNALTAALVQRKGFEGLYVSGAVLAADLGYPDIGLTTASEVVQRAQQITHASDLPTLVDADTGFGEPMNVARTVVMLENAGISACHIEDQVNPKRCGHLDHKEIVDINVMVQRLQAAKAAKRDANFLIMARTDARAVEGFDAALERAKAYVEAGAEAIFAEALHDAKEFSSFKKALNVPLLANMTEFGKSELLNLSALREARVDMVIYPVTLLRLAMKAVERGLEALQQEETQASVVKNMQTRKELYDLLCYEYYNNFDAGLFNFEVPE